MHRLNELAEKLTPQQVKKVEDFAEFLATRAKEAPVARKKPKGINVDALMGMCAGMGGDKSDKQLVREAWDALLAKHDK